MFFSLTPWIQLELKDLGWHQGLGSSVCSRTLGIGNLGLRSCFTHLKLSVNSDLPHSVIVMLAVQTEGTTMLIMLTKMEEYQEEKWEDDQAERKGSNNTGHPSLCNGLLFHYFSSAY